MTTDPLAAPNARYENAVYSDRFSWHVRDAAEAVILHEALMTYRNRACDLPSDVIRAEAADRMLASLDSAIAKLSWRRHEEATVPAEPSND